MKDDAPLFVAETSETGDVAWVWVQDRSGRAARPIRRVSRHLPEIMRPDSRFAGVPKDAIVSWMRAATDHSALR